MRGWMGGMKIAMSGIFFIACRLEAFAYTQRKRLSWAFPGILGRGVGHARLGILRSCCEGFVS